MSSEDSHARAIAAAKTLLIESMSSKFDWSDTLVGLESTVAIVISYIAKVQAPGREEAFATEIMDSLTEAAHARVIKALREGNPDA
jgi:hypothetical protein